MVAGVAALLLLNWRPAERAPSALPQIAGRVGYVLPRIRWLLIPAPHVTRVLAPWLPLIAQVRWPKLHINFRAVFIYPTSVCHLHSGIVLRQVVLYGLAGRGSRSGFNWVDLWAEWAERAEVEEVPPAWACAGVALRVCHITWPASLSS